MSNRTLSVLIVDDDEVVRINLQAFLEDEGLQVVTAPSGEEALKIISESQVDVAVVDMRLPVMDGNSFILKAHELKPQTRFIIHTGSINYTLPETLRKVGIGPERIFLKPVPDMTILLSAIND